MPIAVIIHVVFLLVAIPFIVIGTFFSVAGDVLVSLSDCASSIRFILSVAEKQVKNIRGNKWLMKNTIYLT